VRVPDFVLPDTTRFGARRFIDPSVEEVLKLVRFGDPTVGWVGDERLGFYLMQKGRLAGRWALVRFPEDGSDEVIVALSQPGVDLRTLPAHLAYHDMRRKGAEDDLAAEVRKAEKANAHQESEQLGEAVDTWLSRATRHVGPAPQRAS
jgi:hypothetical protein